MTINFDFAYAGGAAPTAHALFKQQPDDFQVREVLGFEIEDDPKGQHHWLWIEKSGANTDFVAKQLARFVDVPAREVSYSGIKDRQARTWQWFSVQLPATREVDWSALVDDEFRIVEVKRCGRKLRRGSHQSNEFVITLRDVSDAEAVNEALQQVKTQGAPHYFGEQRFGHQGNNISKALTMFAGKRIKDRNLRSLLISAARSYIFNHYLSERIRQGMLQTPIEGDVMTLRGSHSYFIADELDDALLQRFSEGDIDIGGPLWGRGERLSQASAADFEQQALIAMSELQDGLEKAGLKQERRPLRVVPAGLQWQWSGADCEVRMNLPAGAYATSVLREVAQLRSAPVSTGDE
ncbi:tRNA pseudouridine(13) synthase TruD [Aliidiomarina soli]|uniref:tRNA pseudouridine synthase D n=1 Tax=Aliidiomarina soli TaxID=1928574 RepID=A0A432WLW3_9GAMM|nr:tRNA pseudouridine(13) synthase TruD [Aliidiomarina soli]RUO34748.1 tRNA pseudouridine(13) synthase TruD [Aliidiomarina soli]